MDEPQPLTPDEQAALVTDLLTIVQHSRETSRRLPVADLRTLSMGIRDLWGALTAQAARAAALEDRDGLVAALTRYVESDRCDCIVYAGEYSMCMRCQGIYALGGTPDPEEYSPDVAAWLAARADGPESEGG